jgi:hypothetical protein
MPARMIDDYGFFFARTFVYADTGKGSTALRNGIDCFKIFECQGFALKPWQGVVEDILYQPILRQIHHRFLFLE